MISQPCKIKSGGSVISYLACKLHASSACLWCGPSHDVWRCADRHLACFARPTTHVSHEFCSCVFEFHNALSTEDLLNVSSAIDAGTCSGGSLAFTGLWEADQPVPVRIIAICHYHSCGNVPRITGGVVFQRITSTITVTFHVAVVCGSLTTTVGRRMFAGEPVMFQCCDKRGPGGSR